MEEEKEKQLAKQLAEIMEGKLWEADDPEVDEAVETAAIINGAFGGGPDIKPEFDQTLRARLVRETAKEYSSAPQQQAPGKAAVRRRWMNLAVAAVFVFMLVPTVWVIKDKHQDAGSINEKMMQLEEYDKMYVPYSEKVKSGEVDYSRPAPFSDSYSDKVRQMQKENRFERTDTYYKNYRRERRSRI